MGAGTSYSEEDEMCVQINSLFLGRISHAKLLLQEGYVLWSYMYLFVRGEVRVCRLKIESAGERAETVKDTRRKKHWNQGEWTNTLNCWVSNTEQQWVNSKRSY